MAKAKLEHKHMADEQPVWLHRVAQVGLDVDMQVLDSSESRRK